MAGVEVPERTDAPAETPTPAPRLGYIPALDGLRAVAVIAVLLYHGGQAWIPGGFLGVDVFFVISGYLITCLLLADIQQHGRAGLGRFWYRRARRLLPALFTMLTVVSLYALLFLPDVTSKLRGEVFAAVFYVENWFLIYRHLSYFDRTGRPPLLQHVWSLAVEEQFYLLWPLVLTACLVWWGIHRRTMLVGIVVAVGASTILMAVLYQPFHDPSRVYYGTDTRIAALLLGAGLAFIWAPWKLTGRTGRNAAVVLDIAAVISGVILLYMFLDVGELDRGLYHGGFLVAAMVSAVLIAATVHPRARLTPWLLGFAAFRWIGVRSYGIYLWHWPIFMVTRPHSDVPLTGLPLLALRVALTFAIAALSYRFVEEPIRHGAIERQVARYRMSRGDERRRYGTMFGLAGVAGGVCLVVIVVGLAGAQPAKAPEGFPSSGAVLINPGPPVTTAPTTAAATTAPGASTAPTTATAPPATTTAPGLVPAHTTAIGDSVMLGAAQALAKTVNAVVGPDTTRVDAKESRQFSAGVDLIKSYRDAGVLGDRVIVHLGTNGEIDPAEFERLMSILSGVQRVLIVNAKVPRPWEGEVNDTLAREVPKYKNARLVDWHTFGGNHPEFFYNDGIHLKPNGQLAYAEYVAAALGSGTP